MSSQARMSWQCPPRLHPLRRRGLQGHPSGTSHPLPHAPLTQRHLPVKALRSCPDTCHAHTLCEQLALLTGPRVPAPELLWHRSLPGAATEPQACRGGLAGSDTVAARHQRGLCFKGRRESLEGSGAPQGHTRAGVWRGASEPRGWGGICLSTCQVRPGTFWGREAHHYTQNWWAASVHLPASRRRRAVQGIRTGASSVLGTLMPAVTAAHKGTGVAAAAVPAAVPQVASPTWNPPPDTVDDSRSGSSQGWKADSTPSLGQTCPGSWVPAGSATGGRVLRGAGQRGHCPQLDGAASEGRQRATGSGTARGALTHGVHTAPRPLAAAPHAGQTRPRLPQLLPGRARGNGAGRTGLGRGGRPGSPRL